MEVLQNANIRFDNFQKVVKSENLQLQSIFYLHNLKLHPPIEPF
jgi:hypothetical protein